ncbi:hypothetical protein AURDEDRAFT_188812 [Auricularia subglabra TFB-10046 SS5]|nr:hypothetical protein AURDEDRAFT_188812 [Auricularia subglabra TFB-10046 SS5]
MKLQNGGQQRAQRSSSSRRQRRQRQLPLARSSRALDSTYAGRRSNARPASRRASGKPPVATQERRAVPAPMAGRPFDGLFALGGRGSPRGARVVIGVLIRRVHRRIASRCPPASNDDGLALVRHADHEGPGSALERQSSPRAEASSVHRRDDGDAQDAEHRRLVHGHSIIPPRRTRPPPRLPGRAVDSVVDIVLCAAFEAARRLRRLYLSAHPTRTTQKLEAPAPLDLTALPRTGDVQRGACPSLPCAARISHTADVVGGHMGEPWGA